MKKALDSIFTMLRAIHREQKKQTKLLNDIKNNDGSKSEPMIMTADEFEKFKEMTS